MQSPQPSAQRRRRCARIMLPPRRYRVLRLNGLAHEPRPLLVAPVLDHSRSRRVVARPRESLKFAGHVQATRRGYPFHVDRRGTLTYAHRETAELVNPDDLVRLPANQPAQGRGQRDGTFRRTSQHPASLSGRAPRRFGPPTVDESRPRGVDQAVALLRPRSRTSMTSPTMGLTRSASWWVSCSQVVSPRTSRTTTLTSKPRRTTSVTTEGRP